MGHFYLGVILIYLGSLGRMIGIKCPASQNVQAAELFTFRDTVEGRVKAQRRQLGRRSWSLRTSDATTPAESAALQEFANGSWGRGPFWFLSADALVSNVLPPITKVFGPHVDGGPARLAEGGWSPYSMKRSDGLAGTIQFVASGENPPVLPGVSVTGSAWLHGSGATLLMQWYSSAGTLLGSASSAVGQSVGTVFTRVHVTGVPPLNTAFVAMTARDALGATRPAITWTDSLQPYGDGRGCAKAVVHGVSRDQVLAVPGHTFSNLSFTVTEVG